MSLAKISSGDGYEYYLRNVVTGDANERGRQRMEDYYSEKGESPGRWIGAGLAALGITDGEVVTESQMRSLVGFGRHPNAAEIKSQVRAEQLRLGATRVQASRYAEKQARLGRPYPVFADRGEDSYRAQCAQAFADWNTAHARPPEAAVPAAERKRLRTETARRMFAEEYGRAPLDARELSGWTARASRPPRKAVAGYDLTFSPVKSVSALWALAPREIADQIMAAHHAAIRDALAYLEAHAVYTRVGRDSARQVEVDGLIAMAFDHRDARSGDPDLHTHVVVSNKVQRLTGEWGALDGRLIYRDAVAASELYNSRLEQHLEQALGVVFAERGGPDAQRRPVREIVGVDARLLAAWSTRAEEISRKTAELSREFAERQGREPTPGELFDLGQEATLSTRTGKHAARSLADQRAVWRADAARLLGGEQQVAAMVARMLSQQALARDQVTSEWITAAAAEVIDTVAAGRAVWQAHHVRAETLRLLRGRVAPERHADVAEQVVRSALSPPLSIYRGARDPGPAVGVLARRDGTSVYTTAGASMYTSPAIVDAEQRLVAAALTRGGRAIDPRAVRAAGAEFAAAHDGLGLNPGQAALVEEFATSGARLQVAIAPAGTGKTTAMQVLCSAWIAEGGTVLGLAPTGSAAGQLRADTGAETLTVDMLTTVADRLAAGTLDPADAPDWVAAVGDRTLVVLDEAAKCGTLQLDRAVGWLLERGASVRAIGDDQQLSAVAAGGVIRDIVDRAGAQTLTRVMRFADPAESAASLALRHGDTASIAYYLDHGRIQVGTLGAVAEQAFTAWAADTDAGLDSILLAPTRDLVTALNQRARDARRTGRTAGGPEAVLADGLSAAAGDIICTRRNHYGLRISATDCVRNGYRWVVRDVHADGRVAATHLGSGRRVTLPADYVRDHVTLGYAATIDAAQGLTVDTCHGVLTGREHRAQLYVMLTRGRAGNYLYLATAGRESDDLNPHSHRMQHPATAVDLLTDILGRTGTQTSAATIAREAADPYRQLAGTVTAYLDALGAVAEHRLGDEHLAQLADTAEDLAPGVTDEPAWPVLRQHLATLALDGRDPAAVLTAAAQARELDTAHDRAAVLDWRIDPTGRHTRGNRKIPVLGWLPAVPAVLAADPDYGPALREQAQQVADLADQVAATARRWDPTTAPEWAAPFLAPDNALVAELAVWRAAHGVADHDRRPTGSPVYPVVERRAQRQLDAQAAQRLGSLTGVAGRWAPLARQLDPRLVTDPYWPELARRLHETRAAGVDVITAARQAAAARPLPDEQPAAALRWRLTDTLDHPDLAARATFTAAVREVAADRWRRMSDTELTDHARKLRGDLATPAMIARPGLWDEQLTSHVDQVRAIHAERDEQAALVVAAETAIETVRRARVAQRDAAAAWNAIRDEEPDVPWWRPVGRESAAIRADHTRRREELRQAADTADLALLRAEQAARDARRDAILLAGPPDHWAAILDRAGDHACRAAELDAAQQRDRDAARRWEQYQQTRDDWQQQLDDIGTERQRRAELDPAARDLEDRARQHLDGLADAADYEQHVTQQRQYERDRSRDWAIHTTLHPGPSPGGHGIGM